MNFKYVYQLFVLLYFISNISCSNNPDQVKNPGEQTSNAPRIINIINFIRLLEPRDAGITEDVLYQTVIKQIEIMKKYELGGTFLLQYDALLDSRYQKLLKSLPSDSFEIGGWWEVPQPLVENAGMEWRGRYPWDWHADVGFSTGYTPEEREKLVDVYMEDFKEIFGYYPKSVGSWFIDAHTLNYMYQKYEIVASCNCKDQIGTDGYNLWGGYWNQAYYPSKKNAYMPAQNEENQIPVPIFRMLGSDPVRQYEEGIGHRRQGVISLEPVYPSSGGNEDWVNWYFKEFVSGECLEYAYVQAGQENSFTWDVMSKGYELQMPLIAQLRDGQKVKVETLAESGKWFKENYQVTPATSVTINNDLERSDVKTVWFNSRFYRANLLWEHGTLRFRDIHLFDENLQSKYLTEKVNSTECFFFTFPFVDGHVWSSTEETAGLRLKALVNGAEVSLKGGTPTITSPKRGTLHVEWPLESIDGTFFMDFDEQKIDMRVKTKEPIDWYWDLTAKNGAELPFRKISPSVVNCEFDGMGYILNAKNGTFSKPNDQVVLRISPVDNKIILDMADRTIQ